MAIEKTTNNRPSGGGGGDGSRSTLELESLARVDMKKMSQSELYSLSRCSSSAFDLRSPENVVIPNIESDHPSTVSITTAITTPPSRIFAFSHRRGPPYRRRVSASLNQDADPQLTENRFILNSLEKLVAEGEVNDSNPRRDMVAVDNEGEVQKRKRKRKSKAAKENGEEFEGLGVINVNGEEIDLKFLAGVADGAFEAELNRMTEGMMREDEFLGFLKGLEGRWGSSRKRRKYVDAADFVKALPTNWKILLSLRPRVRQPNLYCRRYVSPSGIHFKSCKDAAFYLKSQFVTNVANPREEGAMMPIESDCQADLEPMMPIETDCQVDLELVARVPRSSLHAANVDLLGTNDLRNVPIYNVIECHICRDSFTSIGGLESHLQKFHGTTIQRLDLDTSTRKCSIPHDVVRIQEPKYLLPVTCQIDALPPVIENSLERKTVFIKKEVDPLQDTVSSRNELRLYDAQHLKMCPPDGQGSSSLPEPSNEPKNNSEVKRNFKARCMWCLNEFFREPVDAETLASSSGFICPKCKEEISGRLESTLCRFYQHADK